MAEHVIRVTGTFVPSKHTSYGDSFQTLFSGTLPIGPAGTQFEANLDIDV